MQMDEVMTDRKKQGGCRFKNIRGQSFTCFTKAAILVPTQNDIQGIKIKSFCMCELYEAHYGSKLKSPSLPKHANKQKAQM